MSVELPSRLCKNITSSFYLAESFHEEVRHLGYLFYFFQPIVGYLFMTAQADWLRVLSEVEKTYPMHFDLVYSQ